LVASLVLELDVSCESGRLLWKMEVKRRKVVMNVVRREVLQ
jgi:hypothetical protein